MFKDRYQSVISRVSPDEALVRHTVLAVRAADTTADIRPPRFYRGRLVPAMAAVLAVAVVFGAVLIFHGDVAPSVATTGSHSFVIKAGAAEINPDYYVELGEMQKDGSHFGVEWDRDDEGRYHYTQLDMAQAFVLDTLRCVGEEVEYFTYTVYGGYIIMDGRTGTVLSLRSASPPDREQLMELTADGSFDRFTVTDEEYRAFVAFPFSDDTGKYADLLDNQTVDEDGEVSLEPRYEDIYYDMFYSHIDELSMLITAHYEDGSTQSKTVVFGLAEKHRDDAAGHTYALEAKLATE